MVGEASCPSITQSDVTLDPLILERPGIWNVDRNLVLLESNIDDMTAEHLAFATELLMRQDGVADCWLTPIVMKKGRSAHTLHCLCHDTKCEGILRLIFQHTTTLGVRVQSNSHGLVRVALNRTVVKVPIDIQGSNGMPAQHTIDCKIGVLGAGDIVSIKPEFDECKAVAMATNQSLQFVCENVIHKARIMMCQDNIALTGS